MEMEETVGRPPESSQNDGVEEGTKTWAEDDKERDWW